MNLVAFLLRMSRRAFALATLLGILGGVATSGLIAVIHRASSAAHFGADLAVLFAALCVAVVGTRVLSELLLVRLVQDAVLALRLHLATRILSMPLRQLESLGTSALLVVLTEDIGVLTGVLPALTLLATNVSVVVACLAYLGWLSLKALAGVVAFLVFGVATYQLVATRAIRRFHAARTAQDAVFRHLRSLVDGMKELKLHRRHRDAFVRDEVATAMQTYRDESVVAQTTYVAAASWGHLLFFVAVALLLMSLGRVGGIDAASANGYTLTLLYMMGPLEGVMGIVPMIGRASAALRKVEGLGVSLASEEPVGAPPLAAAGSLRSIELAAVRHAYPRERDGQAFVLGPLDVMLRPGEIVFVVGGNGSGKSTLAKVLTGLYVPEGGEVRWNGDVVTGDLREAYRQMFSVVFADYHLFDRLESISSDAATRAPAYILELELEHKVSVRDGALSTTALSQGQRKRLALLNAFLSDRPVYVFDEWASDQDPVFKAIFYKKILPDLRARGKLVVAITHDDRYFDLADRILKLEDGNLTEIAKTGEAAVSRR